MSSVSNGAEPRVINSCTTYSANFAAELLANLGGVELCDSTPARYVLRSLFQRLLTHHFAVANGVFR